MSDIQTKKIDVEPMFDLMGFLELSQETRLDGGTGDLMEKLWKEWGELIQAHAIACGKTTYVAVWLPESVEKTIDETWDRSPSDGYMANALAQYMCMQVVSDILPQVEVTGCAPAPRPTTTLREALAGLGLAYRDDISVLERRFAVVTHYPFRGGCEICYLQKDCPKGRGDSDAGSILLPGFEHGRQ